MTVDVIGEDKRLLCAKGVIEKRGAPFRRVVLLPIPTKIKSEHPHLSDLGEGDAVVGYGICPELCDMLKSRQVYLYDAEKDEEFLSINAELTAVGVLGEIITATDKAPSAVRYGIIGYGRIGKSLLKYLTFLGAEVSVFTTRESVVISLGEWGVHAEMPDTPEAFSKVDVLINTAPTEIVDIYGARELLRSGVKIFDLASGESFGGCESVVRLKGVPGARYPMSAGVAYAECFFGALRTDGLTL